MADRSIGDMLTAGGAQVAAELHSGETFGQYHVHRALGRGGMGQVYEVEHEVLHRRFALKILPHEMVIQPGFLARFQREAQVMANLEHPGIVRVDDFGEIRGLYWLRMELIGGVNLAPSGASGRAISLADYAKAFSGRIPQGRLAEMLAAILEALAYAHEKGAVHRDLKPSNILLQEAAPGKILPRISDFGLVRIVGEEWLKGQAERSVSSGMSMGATPTIAPGGGESTRSLLGTYEYMSPEQKRGEEADARSDLYAVGLMTFRLLTGQQDIGFDLPSRLDSSLDGAWDELVRRAVNPVPDKRWNSAKEMRLALGVIEQSLVKARAQEEARARAEAERKLQEETARRETEERRQREEEEHRKEIERLTGEAQAKLDGDDLAAVKQIIGELRRCGGAGNACADDFAAELHRRVEKRCAMADEALNRGQVSMAEALLEEALAADLEDQAIMAPSLRAFEAREVLSLEGAIEESLNHGAYADARTQVGKLAEHGTSGAQRAESFRQRLNTLRDSLLSQAREKLAAIETGGASAGALDDVQELLSNARALDSDAPEDDEYSIAPDGSSTPDPEAPEIVKLSIRLAALSEAIASEAEIEGHLANQAYSEALAGLTRLDKMGEWGQRRAALLRQRLETLRDDLEKQVANLIRSGHAREAAQAARSWLALAPDDPKVQKQARLAEVYLKATELRDQVLAHVDKQEYDKACTVLAELQQHPPFGPPMATRIKPRFNAIARNLSQEANTCIRSRQWAEARAKLELALKLEPDSESWEEQLSFVESEVRARRLFRRVLIGSVILVLTAGAVGAIYLFGSAGIERARQQSKLPVPTPVVAIMPHAPTLGAPLLPGQLPVPGRMVPEAQVTSPATPSPFGQQEDEVRRKLMLATAPGTHYIGIITWGNQRKRIRLVFTEQKGFLIRAEASNPDRPSDKQTFTGELVFSPQPENGKSGEGYAIVLSPVAQQMQELADRWAFYVNAGSLKLRLTETGLEGQANMGYDWIYTIRLQRETPTEPAATPTRVEDRTEGKVLSVDNGKLVVDLGERNRLQLGSILTVTLSKYPITVPGQASPLGYEELDLRVERVQKDSCEAVVVGTTDKTISPGDGVRVKSLSGQ